MFFRTSDTNAGHAEEDYLNEDFEITDFDSDDWEDLTEDLDYSENISLELDEDPDAKEWDLSFLGVIGRIILWLIVGIFAVALIYVLYRLALNQFYAVKDLEGNGDLEYQVLGVDKELSLDELSTMLQDCLSKGDYAQAIRVYYVSIIKLLDRKELIRWRKDKTNSDLLKELRNTEVFKPFLHVTLWFDRIWYGQRKVDQVTFDKIDPLFKDLLNNLNNR